MNLIKSDCIHCNICKACPCPDKCKNYLSRKNTRTLPILPGSCVYVDGRILNAELLDFEFEDIPAEGEPYIIACLVQKIQYDHKDKCKISLKPFIQPLGNRYHIFVTPTSIGKTVFVDYDEAEKCLHEEHKKWREEQANDTGRNQSR